MYFSNWLDGGEVCGGAEGKADEGRSEAIIPEREGKWKNKAFSGDRGEEDETCEKRGAEEESVEGETCREEKEMNQ